LLVVPTAFIWGDSSIELLRVPIGLDALIVSSFISPAAIY
jgi:hypothetical protein